MNRGSKISTSILRLLHKKYMFPTDVYTNGRIWYSRECTFDGIFLYLQLWSKTLVRSHNINQYRIKMIIFVVHTVDSGIFFYQGRKVKITNNNIISELYGYIVPSQKGDALLSCELFFFIFFFRFFFRFSCIFCPVHNFLSFDIDFWYSKIPHFYVPFWWPLILTLYVKVK